MIRVRNNAGHRFDFGDHGVVLEEGKNEFKSLPAEVVDFLKAYDTVEVEQLPDETRAN